MEPRLLLLLLQAGWAALHSLQPDGVSPDGLRLAVLADWGGMPLPPYFTPHQKAVSAVLEGLVQSEGLDFILSLGDHFYYNGVQSVDDPRFKHTFEGVFSQPALQDVPWFLVGGNHDHRGNIWAQLQYSNRSQRWNYPDLYYDLHWSDRRSNVSLSVLMIDTVVLCGNTLDQLQPSGPPDAAAAERHWSWINKQLSSSRSDYLLVAGHFPVWSVGNHGPTACLVQRLRPLLRKHRASLYLSGHDHDLQFIREDDGSSYVVSGSGVVSDPSVRHAHSVPRSWQLFSSAAAGSLGGLVLLRAGRRHMELSLLQTDHTCAYRAQIPRRRA